MARAGVQPGEIDVIILATASPDHLLPATAVEVQTALGCSRAAAFDLGAACTGWLYSTIVAESLIANGSANTVLVIGAERLSAIVDWTDRNTCIVFGDGAGATVMRRAEKQQTRGVLSSFMRSDGALAELLWRPAGGGVTPSRRRPSTNGSTTSTCRDAKCSSTPSDRWPKPPTARSTRHV